MQVNFQVISFVIYNIICAFAFISSILEYNLAAMEWNNVLPTFKELIRFGLGLTPKLNQTSTDELTLQWKITCIILLYVRFHKWIMVDLVGYLGITSAFISLRCCNELYSLMLEPGNPESLV